MKNNIYRISAIIIILTTFFASLVGCSFDDISEQETMTETTQRVTTETVQTTKAEMMHNTIQGNEQEILTSWRTAYKKVIVNFMEDCKLKYPDESNYGGYGLYDFDSDGIPELFLEGLGSASVDRCIRIYDFDGDEAVFIDSIESAHSWVYGTNRDNAFLAECCWMGESVWTIYEQKNGEFVSKELASYYPDGFGDDIEPQENPLLGMGYEIKKIDYYFLDDLSGIKS